MALSDTQIEELAEKFEETFNEGNGKELGARFRVDDEATSEDIIDQALMSENFPMDANMYNVETEILIHSGMSTEDWAEEYIEAHNVSNDEEFQFALNDDLYDFITENLEKTSIEVNIKESLATWLEEHGTVEYLEQEMEKNYEVIIMQELIEQSSDYEIHQKVKEALNEEGFPDEVRPEDVDYGVYDIKLTESFESLAERHIDDIEQYGGVSQYIKDEFHQDIIDDEAYTFSVSIESDREDFL
ncbi:methylmalonyl-CoA mutase family protein [Staphylococcus pettenkoferi]|uniref:methylmalonyl-CoA mutase family protein n=2 Tax=Bacilli TaxID=91061 RepID=UPI0025563459|nr:methylmalonyl-CoA mutase family protein [Staphylococcus pettenkoferi]MDK7284287.1 methylmalonyl-CoA mutase family protein [Staphylococcus pettenkoferi]